MVVAATLSNITSADWNSLSTLDADALDDGDSYRGSDVEAEDCNFEYEVGSWARSGARRSDSCGSFRQE